MKIIFIDRVENRGYTFGWPDVAWTWIVRFGVGLTGPTLQDLLAWCEEYLHDYHWSSSHKTLWLSDTDVLLFKLRWYNETS